MIIEGSISVKAALQGKKRKVNEVIIDKNKYDKNTNYIVKLAKKLNVTLKFVDRNIIDEMSFGKTHGGIIADVEYREYDSLDSCFLDNSFICLIEGIEDPFNLGHMIRSLYSAGCSGIIFNDRDWSIHEGVILKASAGAFDFINIYKSNDLKSSVLYAKDKGCVCYAACRSNAVSYFDIDYRKPILISIGGEMRGLSKDVLNTMDKNIYIPYANEFRNSLSASSACVAISYEVLRQRGYNK